MMERRFSMNDFEQSLKEHADEFKMIPSKRVWHGIYNDMHPGRRWPSVTMALLLIFTLVFIGQINTHKKSQLINSKNTLLQSTAVATNLKTNEISKVAPQLSVAYKSNVTALQHGNILSKQESNINNDLLNNNDLPNNSLLTQNSKLNNILSGPAEFEKNIFFSERNTDLNDIENNIFENNNIQSENTIGKVNKVKVIKEKIPLTNSDNNLQSDRQIAVENTTLKYTRPVNSDISDLSKNKPDETNKKPTKLKRKKNNKISWVYFAAPQVNTVSFSGAPIKSLLGPNYSVAITQSNYKVLHNSALGFEAGLQMNYTLAKKLWFTSGLHITYSGYNIISNEVHPTFATLILKDLESRVDYPKDYITHYGNGSGQTGVLLHNYSLQASMPVGLQYQLSGNNKVRFNVETSLEPSLVIKSNAYILSSNGNNYINDPGLLRKFNMNSNFGVSISFNSDKFNWSIGPNIRYQWFSTYKRDYTVKEHLIDYGIRISISPLRK